MKTIVTILIACTLSVAGYAQNPELFENEWYLQKIIIDGVEHVAPHNEEIDFVQLNIFQDLFNTSVCEGLSGHGLTITNTDISVFELVLLIDEPCYLAANNTFQSLYYNDFFEFQSPDPDRFFSYQIDDEGDSLFMVWTNSTGDKAFYGNQLLSNENLKVLQFFVYPNPVKNILVVKSTKPITKVVFYDVLGKKLLSINQDFQQMDVSSLSKGVYFVTITTEKGKMVRKVVKD